MDSENNKSFVLKYKAIRKRSLELCEPLLAEDTVVQPAEFVSPPKWHLGHTTWYFETFILNSFQQGYSIFHDQFNFIFNSYYETLGNRVVRKDRGNLSRPCINLTKEYREHVDQHLIAWLENDSIPEEGLRILELGLQHEQQHQELLLTDIKYIFGTNPIQPKYFTQTLCEEYSEFNQEEYLSIKGGIYSIGHADKNTFCFDNEQAVHDVLISDFEISSNLVTNGDYIEFIEEAGYHVFEHWMAEGWEWINNQNILAPLYWEKVDGIWHYYTLSGLQLIDAAAPLCHISYFEADAFARWKGERLPTEFEWEVAAPKLSIGLRWEWTNSAYLPYPKFQIAEGALGEYNGKFMANQMVLRGGSVATPEGHSRLTYRNFLHTDLQWQFSGIRLAR